MPSNLEPVQIVAPKIGTNVHGLLMPAPTISAKKLRRNAQVQKTTLSVWSP